MAKIGIIGAMNSEVVNYCSMFGAQKTKIDGVFSAFYLGHEVFICESGIGKVNAALSAQRLIDVFKVQYLINSGVAGCLTKELSTCDAVIAKELIYHDFTPLDILDRNSPFTSRFKADANLCEIAENACDELINNGEEFKYITGNIVSGDCFVSSSEKAKELRENFGAFCTEMEGAAIAHTAIVNKIPFAVIRTVSDFADENAEISFETVEKIAAKRASFIVTKMLEEIPGKEEITKATANDIDAICDIVRKAAERMKLEKNNQWDENYPTRKIFEKDLLDDCLYVYRIDGKTVGTVCITNEIPEEYEKVQWKSSEKPSVIHRMAVYPEYRGYGISSKLFDFAKNISNGCIHADTYCDNILMNALYIKNGFTKVGEMMLPDKPKSFNCFEWIR